NFLDCEQYRDIDSLVDSVYSVLLPSRTGGWLHHHRRNAGNRARDLMDQIRKAKLGLGGVEIERTPTDQATWDGAVRDLLGDLAKREGATVLILDEFPMMLETWCHRGIPNEQIVGALAWLRALRQSQPGRVVLSLVIGGSVSLDYWLRRLN